MKERPLVYLAGPITGTSYKEATDWRNGVVSKLTTAGYKCLTPMRGKEALKHIKDFPAHSNPGIGSDHNIFERDRYDVHRCDVLLVNLTEAKRVSIGTMFEMAWGWKAGKFVLTVIDNDENPHNHAFVYQASSLVVHSLDEAVQYLSDVLNS